MFLKRPVFFLTENGHIFNYNGCMFGSKIIKEAFMHNFEIPQSCLIPGTSDERIMPYKCVHFKTEVGGFPMLVLDDGLVNDFHKLLNHRKVSSFSDKHFGFVSPSIVSMNVQRYLNKKYEPMCALNLLLTDPAPRVFRKTLSLFEALDQDTRVIGMHIRRGDSAMFKECEDCTNPNEPDNHSADRITMKNVLSSIHCVNRSMNSIKALGYKSVVFVMSDTHKALDMVKRNLGGATLLHFHGKTKHSKTKHMSVKDDFKLASDVLAYTLSDVHIQVGSSSLSGNAANAALQRTITPNQDCGKETLSLLRST